MTDVGAVADVCELIDPHYLPPVAYTSKVTLFTGFFDKNILS